VPWAAAAGLAVAIGFPFLVPTALRTTRPADVGFVVAVGLAGVRLVMQLTGPFLEAAAATVGLATVGLTAQMAVSRQSPDGGGAFVRGLLAGLSLDTAIVTAFQTWDLPWQDGVWPWSAAVAICGAVLAGVVRSPHRRHDHPPKDGSARVPSSGAFPSVALGAFLVLQLMLLENVGVVGSDAGTSVPVAGAVILLGVAVGQATLLLRAGPPVAMVAAFAAFLAVAPALAIADGPTVAVLTVLGQGIAAFLLRAALSVRDGAAHRSPVSASGALALATAAILLGISQLPRLVALPLGPAWWAVAAALALGSLAVRTAPRGGAVSDGSRSLVALPLTLLAVPIALAAASGSPPADTVERPVRLVSYNVRSALGPGGEVDPEALARVIEEQHPDLVALQEVGRGWVVAGSLDLAAWLAHRLDMSVVWAPEGDERRGNALLSSGPAPEHIALELPHADEPVGGSALIGSVELSNRRVLRLIVTHLQHGADQTATRLGEIEAVLRAWDGSPLTILAGDMNAGPGTPEILRLLGAGFVSAGDGAGGDDTPTFPSTDPARRIDWILGTADLRFSGFDVVRTAASDHLPLVVTVEA
jgi:endonuclease/exonuclease/phosphatase family metal-dependent hydrolase